MQKVDKKALLKDIETIMNMSPNLTRSIYFKVLALKDTYKEEIERYKKIIGIMDGGPPLNVEFELTYKNGAWTLSMSGNPIIDNKIIPPEIVNYIIKSTVKPGIIKMVNDFETKDKRKFNISFEKQTEDYFTVSIIEKTRNETQQTSPLKQAGNTDNTDSKTEDIKTILHYLLTHEFLYEHIHKEFFLKWRPYIDNEVIAGSQVILT